MRVLVVAPLAATHMTAMVPLCWALRAGGHELLVACAPDMAPVVRGAGLCVAVVGADEPVHAQINARTSPDFFPATPFGDRTSQWGRFVWETAAEPQTAYADRRFDAYLRLARQWRPDVVLYDHIALIGRLLGAVLGVASISHRWGLDPTAGPFEDKVRRDLAPLCRKYDRESLPRPDLVLDPCPPCLQVEDAEPGLRMRYVPFNGTGVRPSWAGERPPRPRVCVCLGGTVLDVVSARPLHAIAEAFGAANELEIVVAVTPANRRAVGALPERFQVVESLPLQLFLDTCDLVVCAGGAGTGLTACAFGVPQVVLPQWFDQFDYGRRLADAGAGVTLPTLDEQSDTGGLRDTAEKIIGDGSYRTAARDIARQIEAAPAPATIVAKLVELAG